MQTQRTDLERSREEMMEHEADDLPFHMSRNRPATGRNWGILALVVVVGLSIPLFYIALSLLSSLMSDSRAFLGVIFGALVGFAALGWLMYSYLVGSVEREEQYMELEKKQREKSVTIYNYEEKNMTTTDLNSKTVREVMSANPMFCGDLDSVNDCARDMYKFNVGYLIVRHSDGSCVGVVTDRDLVCGALAQSMDPVSTPVTLVMERTFVSVPPEASISDALKLMQDNGWRRVPVMSGDSCVGVLSIDDLIVKKACGLDEIATVISRQLSEPTAPKGTAKFDHSQAA